ncbi:hypothetical protein [Loktanella salsilacus]|uniref:hypothetical protein n=1 Tax=Loktanella salsilacus TaxID=195913 RepID=UPI0037362D63
MAIAIAGAAHAMPTDNVDADYVKPRRARNEMAMTYDRREPAKDQSSRLKTILRNKGRK